MTVCRMTQGNELYFIFSVKGCSNLNFMTYTMDEELLLSFILAYLLFARHNLGILIPK